MPGFSTSRRSSTSSGARASGAKLVAVIVDTSAAFYMADEENDNVSMRRHASMLRELTRLPEHPGRHRALPPHRGPRRQRRPIAPRRRRIHR